MRKGDQDDIDEVVFEDEEVNSLQGDPVKKLKKAKADLKQCQVEKQEYLDGWQRAKADLVNLNKESETRLRERIEREKMGLFESVLPVLDSFDMAMQGDAWHKVDSNWRVGVEQIHAQLVGVIMNLGITTIEPKEGETYNASLHEPVDVKPTESEKDGSIAAITQRGYRYNDAIIRPAKVIIYETNSNI